MFGILLICMASHLINAEKERLFTSYIITLQDYDFFQSTQFEKKQEKPWFILFYTPYCQYCREFIPIFEDLAQKVSKDKVNVYLAAIDCNENEDVRDRIVIPQFPSLIYFDMNGEMHKYQGNMGISDLEEFIIKDGWKNVPAKKIPKEINLWKRFLRKLVSPYVIVPCLIVLMIGLTLWVVQEQRQRDIMRRVHHVNLVQQSIQLKKKDYLKLD